MRRAALLGVAVFAGMVLAAGQAFGQTYYVPQQYQYQTATGRTFYYAGSDPAVFAAEARLAAIANLPKYPAYAGLRIYSDAAPGLNAAVYGFSVARVANESNGRAATYFSMRQLHDRATVLPDGTRVVPSTAGEGGTALSAAKSAPAADDPNRPGYIRVIVRPVAGMMGGTPTREATPACPPSVNPSAIQLLPRSGTSPSRWPSHSF